MFINDNLLRFYPKYMHLRIFVDGDSNPDLYVKYYEAIYNHNSKINEHPMHIDAGFDLFAPYQMGFTSNNVNKLNFDIKCSAQIVLANDGKNMSRSYNTGYYMHPRSSISKTPLRLANSTGIVDSGYRGNLIGMFDCIQPNYNINTFDRLIQICAPELIPIHVELVDREEQLGAHTLRGEHGIGSSGR